MENIQEMVPVPCPLCQSADYKLYVHAPSHYGPEKYAVTKCSNCGMVFTNPQLSKYTHEVEQRGALDRHFSAAHLTGGCRNAQLQLCLFEQYAKGRRILDFGCGAGMFVHEAMQAGWDATGYDLNHGLVEAANKHWNFQAIHSGSLERFFAEHPGPYDAILSNQVFEHLQQPLVLGSVLVKHLTVGGLIYIDVPNVNQPREWFNKGTTLDPTAHWCHFSTRTLSLLVEMLGCEVQFCSAAPGLVGFWHTIGFNNLASKLGSYCKRILPPIGSGVCAIASKKRNVSEEA